MTRRAKKRTPEEIHEAIEEVKSLLKNDPNLSVEDALKTVNLQASTYYKYRGKRGPYAKTRPSVSEVLPIEAPQVEDLTGGARRWTIITNDPEVIKQFLGKE
jgi:antitoxin component HigA of HigAB toxin-antitoxin module